jgi:hypothetical protein
LEKLVLERICLRVAKDNAHPTRSFSQFIDAVILFRVCIEFGFREFQRFLDYCCRSEKCSINGLTFLGFGDPKYLSAVSLR